MNVGMINRGQLGMLADLTVYGGPSGCRDRKKEEGWKRELLLENLFLRREIITVIMLASEHVF